MKASLCALARLVAPVNIHPDITHATRQALDGLEAVCLEIVEQVYARPILERCVSETFPQTVKEECDKWIRATGEPKYGAPYTLAMRDKFYAVIIPACGKALQVEGFYNE
jgi:hypothetical protein